ncbi:ABC transporter permease [Pseudoalteromonas rhizosphaerae]|uniref:ABC transporter permease n=1 Tax=Pseudoalteromonas rhizosphaerae TaxID=2518973 RepID=UPI003851352D
MSAIKVFLNKHFHEWNFAIAVIVSLAIPLTAFLSSWNLLEHLTSFKTIYKNNEEIFVIEGEFSANNHKRYRHLNWPVAQQWLQSSQTELSAHFISLNDLIEYNAGKYDKAKVGFATENYFGLLGVQALHGRLFDSSDKRGTGSNSAVLSYAAWNKYKTSKEFKPFSIIRENQTFRVIGVLPEGFNVPSLYTGSMFGDVEPDVWVGMDFLPSYANHPRSLSPFFALFGRGTKGFKKLESQLNIVAEKHYENIDSKNQNWAVTAHISALQERVSRDSIPTVKIILGAIGVLLLITLVNLTLYSVSNSKKASFDYAIKFVYGGTRKEIFMSIFKRYFALIGISVILALLLSVLGVSVVQSLGKELIPNIDNLMIGNAIIGYSAIICLIISLLFTAFSYAVVLPKNLKESLNMGSKGNSKQISPTFVTLQNALQTAFAFFVIVISSVIFMNSVDMLSKPKGFDSDDIYFVNLNLSVVKKSFQSKSDEVTAGDYNQFLNSVSNVLKPFSEGSLVVPSMRMPLTSFSRDEVFASENVPIGYFTHEMVGSRYFDLMGIETLQGTTIFDSTNDTNSVIVSGLLSEELSKDQTDNFISTKKYKNMAVVGVVGDVFSPSSNGDVIGRYYRHLDLKKWPLPSITFLIKAKKGKSISLLELSKALKELDNRIIISDFDDLKSSLREKGLNVEISAWLTAILCFLTLLTVFVGIFGIQSYNVECSKSQIGTRIAVGATRKILLTNTLKALLSPLLVGNIVGIFVARNLETKLGNIVPNMSDMSVAFYVPTLVIVSSLLIIAAAIPIYKTIKSHSVVELLNN